MRDIFLSSPLLLRFSEAHQEKRILYDIEVFAVGTYRGITFTPQDIEAMARNFSLLKEKMGLDVPLKVDHTDEAKAIIGWVLNVKARDGLLYVDAEITEPTAFEKIVRGTWKKVSCEIYLDFTDEEGKSWGKVLRAVAIVAHPQVKKIRGLEVARFFEITKTNLEVINMSIREAISTAFGWLSQRFRSLAEEAGYLSFTAVRHSLPYDKAPEETPWDGESARARLAKWASQDGSGEKDKVDWSKFREGFAWYEPGREDFSAYKLPHHDIVDGKFCVVWQGVVSAMSALKGARGGVDIPPMDAQEVYNHLRRHYEEFGRKAPEWEEEGEIEILKAELERKEEIIKRLEEERRVREEEEKRAKVETALEELLEKGFLTPAEKEKWLPILFSLGEEERQKALEVLGSRRRMDLEERSKVLPPEEEEARMSEEAAKRLLRYVAPRSGENK